MRSRIRYASLVCLVGASSLAGLAIAPGEAEACGCVSPPVPTPGAVAFAVAQRGEQILFEVEPGFVTAHDLIRYSGAPEKFAWIVPVPSVPELSLSHESTFALLDTATAPTVSTTSLSACPAPRYTCN